MQALGIPKSFVQGGHISEEVRVRVRVRPYQ